MGGTCLSLGWPHGFTPRSEKTTLRFANAQFDARGARGGMVATTPGRKGNWEFRNPEPRTWRKRSPADLTRRLRSRGGCAILERFPPDKYTWKQSLTAVSDSRSSGRGLKFRATRDVMLGWIRSILHTNRIPFAYFTWAFTPVQPIYRFRKSRSHDTIGELDRIDG